jgi:hypothetical protein
MTRSAAVWPLAALLSASLTIAVSSRVIAETVSVSPATMPRIGTIDQRYQSYNIEMLEVTGGKFWRPYGPELDSVLAQPASTLPSGSGTPAGMNPALYQYRPPIDLTNARLRKLASALGPAYVRVSGTWENTSYFPVTDEVPADPPKGFSGILSHERWKGVITFAKAVDAEIVTSFANSVGTRDARGAWMADQAKRFVDYTKAAGGRIAAAEFMNEPTLAVMGGAPAGYNAADYGRDFKLFHSFARQAAPDMMILGPGSVGETTGQWGIAYGSAAVLNSRDLLAASEPEPTKRLRSIAISETNSIPASRSGSPRRPMPHAAGMHGRAHFLIHSATSISWGGLPSKTCKLSFTILLWQATMACSTTTVWNQSPTIGVRCCGGGSWHGPFWIPARRSKRDCISTHNACAACQVGLPYSPSTTAEHS